MPLVSVIIPVYNGEQTIEQTVDSVLRQSWTDFELIVVDDGSEDGTRTRLGRISDDRLQVLSGAHAGANACRNRGLFRASGEYVAFLDADDLWTSDKLEAQLRALQAHPEAAVAYSWTDRIDAAGQFLRRGGYISVSGDVLADLLLINFLESGSNPLIRRQAAIAVGGFDPSLPACQDWDMWLRLAAKSRFVCVRQPQVLYRVSPRSVSSRVLVAEAACLRVIDRAFAAAPAPLQPLKRQSLANVYQYFLFKLFEEPLTPEKRAIAARFLIRIVQCDPAMLRVRITWKVLLNLLLGLLPAPVRGQIVRRSQRFTNVEALLAHLRLPNCSAPPAPSRSLAPRSGAPPSMPNS